ncbi:MAG: hypothetical protein Q8K96_05530 [Rubrivivax sp.]|nr:hypothetical protein [Rubrivivax sp.]
MQPIDPNPSNEPGAPDQPRAVGPSVLLVVASPDRCQALRGWIVRLAPHAVVDSSESVLDAMLRAARKSPDLLVLDFGVDGAAAPALIRHLARIAPSSDVRVFDDIEQPLPGSAFEVWPWHEAEAVLQRWFEARRPGGTPPE